MAKTTTDKEARVAPLFKLASPDGEERMQTFDKAWQRSQALPVPVDATLEEWVRVDK